MTRSFALLFATQGAGLPVAQPDSTALALGAVAGQTATVTWVALWGYAMLCGAWSARHLWTDSARDYALARGAGDCALCCALLLVLSGVCWAQLLRDRLWVWDPGMTAGLLALLLVGAVALLASSLPNRPPERRYVAALGIFAAANLPFVHYAATLWGESHAPPGASLLASQGTVPTWVASVVAGAVLLWLRARARLRQPRGGAEPPAKAAA